MEIYTYFFNVLNARFKAQARVLLIIMRHKHVHVARHCDTGTITLRACVHAYLLYY